MLAQEHRAALGKLPSKVAAMVPGREYADALRSAGMSEKGPRFVNFAELAALEALKVHASCCLGTLCVTAAGQNPAVADMHGNTCLLSMQCAALSPDNRETQITLWGCCQDAEWEPVSMEEREATGVAMGSGLSCTTELAQAGTYVIQGLVRKWAPPSLLHPPTSRMHSQCLSLLEDICSARSLANCICVLRVAKGAAASQGLAIGDSIGGYIYEMKCNVMKTCNYVAGSAPSW